MGLNLNELARKVTAREGGKKNQSIAQVKETIKCTFDQIRQDLADDEYAISDIIKKLGW